ncbi:MAG: MscL family protein, partial [Pseudomonadota bacterium]
AKEAGAVLAYGNFITVVVNFLILAFIIFLMVRYVNKLRAAMESPEEPVDEAPAAPPADIQLLTEIRDALKK